MKDITHVDKKINEIVKTFLKKYYKKGMRLIDYGAGDLKQTKLAEDIGYYTYAMDIKLPKEISSKNMFQLIDLNKNNLKLETKFDIVIAIEVIEHLENPHKVFRDINLILKKDGIVLLTTPNTSSLRRRINYLLTGKTGIINSKNNGHINELSSGEFKQLANKYGFEIIKETTEGLWLPVVRTYISEILRPIFKDQLGESRILYLKKLLELKNKDV